jgi:hypothetical protein
MDGESTIYFQDYMNIYFKSVATHGHFASITSQRKSAEGGSTLIHNKILEQSITEN